MVEPRPLQPGKAYVIAYRVAGGDQADDLEVTYLGQEAADGSFTEGPALGFHTGDGPLTLRWEQITSIADAG